MNSLISIRPMQEKDISAIREIFLEFVNYHSKIDSSFLKIDRCEMIFSEYLSKEHQRANFKVLIAEYRKIIAGYCVCAIQEKPPVYPDRFYGYVDNIAVKQEFQRKSIGEQLFRKAREWFCSKEISRIEINAAAGNRKSNNFWRKMGFSTFMHQMYMKTD